MKKLIMLCVTLSSTLTMQTFCARVEKNKNAPKHAWTYNNPNYPLHSAAAAGDVLNTQTLLAQPGANIHALDEYKRPVLFVAVVYAAKLDVINLLLARGANPNQLNERTNQTPLDYARRHNPMIAQLLETHQAAHPQ